MKKNKLIFSLVGLVGLTSVGFCLSQHSAKKSVPVLADGETPTLLERDQLSVTQKNMSSSGDTRSFTFGFSCAYVGRTNKYSQMYLAVEDPTFIESDQTSHAGTDADPYPSFKSYVAGLNPSDEWSGVDGDGDHGYKYLLAFPSGLVHARSYILQLDEIRKDTMTAATDYSDIFAIYIPETVTTIEDEAFVNVPSGVTFYCQSASKNPGWGDNWTDAANIQYGVQPEDLKAEFDATYLISSSDYDDPAECRDYINKQVLLRATTTSKEFTGQYDFAIGYQKSVSYESVNAVTKQTETITKDFDLPMKVSYDIQVGNSSVERRTQELPIVNSTIGYDAVGSNIGATSTEFSFDVTLGANETIDTESFSFSNIYYIDKAEVNVLEGETVVTKRTGPYVPYVEEGEFYVEPYSFAKEMIYQEDIFGFKATGISTFGGYTQISLEISNNMKEAFKKLDPKDYEDNLDFIKSGKYYIRLRFRYLNAASIYFQYKTSSGSKESEWKLDPPVAFDYVIIGSNLKGNPFGVNIKNSNIGADFSADKIEKIKLKNLTVSLELVEAATGGFGNRYVSVRFGSLDIYDKSVRSVPIHNLERSLLIVYLVYLVGFIGATAGLFFYMKNKYKNDEFKRLKPKKFFIAAIKNLVGTTLVTLSITFLVFRSAFMNSQVVLFNPLDVFVIAFTVAAGIYLGFMIKNLVVAIRHNIANKKKAKLKLDADSVDDGTN